MPGPGAREANVLRYIDRSLAAELSCSAARLRRRRTQHSTRTRSRSTEPTSPSLSTDRQDAVLTDMDLNRATGFKPNAQGGLRDDPHARGAGHVRRSRSRREHGHGRAGSSCASRARACHQRNDQQLDVVPKSNMQSTYSMQLFASTCRGGLRCQRFAAHRRRRRRARSGRRHCRLAARNAGLKVVGIEAGPRLTVSDHPVRRDPTAFATVRDVQGEPARCRRSKAQLDASRRRGRSARPGR